MMRRLVLPFVLLLAGCQSMDDLLMEQQHQTITYLRGALEGSFFAKNIVLGPVNSDHLPSIEFQFQRKDRKSRVVSFCGRPLHCKDFL